MNHSHQPAVDEHRDRAAGAAPQKAYPPVGGKQSRLAWMLLGVLFAGSVLNYLDRAVLAVVMPHIRRTLSLSNTDYGVVVNAFLIFYMIFYVVGGRISDRLGSRRSFVINVIGWSVAAMLHALSRGLLSLCAFRALLGAAEGGFYPTAIRSVSEWFPISGRAKAVGVLLCGLSVGSLIAPPIVASITLSYGWRAAFLFTGALGFLLLPPWLILHTQAKRIFGTTGAAQAEGLDPSTGESSTTSLFQVLRQKKYLCLLGARSITDVIWFFCLFWIPGYFQDARGFNLTEVGHWLWIPYFFGDIGALAGTWTSSAFIRRGVSLDRSRKIVLVPSALLALCGTATFYGESRFVSLFALSVALFGIFSWAGNVQTAITEVVPLKHVAVLYGITGAVGTFLAAMSQLLIGRIVDRVGYEPVFIALGTGLLLALVLVLAAGEIVLWQPPAMKSA